MSQEKANKRRKLEVVSIDPVQLIKIPLIQYMFGINSMRQTIREIQVNMAYRWFLGFAYVTQRACDKNGWILDYTIHPGKVT